MKKDLLFVIPSLMAGGGQKSLVNLLSIMDYSKYNVDLLLLEKSGIFLNTVPPQVNIIELNGDHTIFAKGLLNSIISSICKGKIRLAINRFLFALKNNFIKNEAVAEQKSWKNLQNAIPLLDKYYDAAIGFLEKTSIYIVTEKVKAAKKIGFIHNDYKQLGLDSQLDIPYFQKLDALVTVSEECANVLKSTFPNLSKKVVVIYNIVSQNLINELAKSGSAPEINNNDLSILSIGRLHPQKGFDLAIEACKKLIQKELKVKWYVIGEGHEREKLTHKIIDNNLQEHFFLIGLRENPYPYIKKASIYCQTSIFEGKSIAIDEAKILNKVIVTTNFTTVKDQIQHGINGIITEMNSESIAEGLVKILDNTKLQSELIFNLSKEDLGTENEILKLYKLIDD